MQFWLIRLIERVVKVLDIKTPASQEENKNKFENISYLTKQDQIKFVICDEPDYLWCKHIVLEHDLENKCEILFSPSHDQLDAATLAAWILQDQLNVRFQVQLHKYLWGDKQGCLIFFYCFLFYLLCLSLLLSYFYRVALISATVLAVASQSFKCHAVSFNYAQLSLSELNAAEKLAESFAASHQVIHIDSGVMAGSALTDKTIAVPERGCF